jgi:hypothetical protein
MRGRVWEENVSPPARSAKFFTLVYSKLAELACTFILDPQKVPKPDSVSLPTYGNDAIGELIAHYGEDRDAETTDGEETVKKAMVTSDLLTEWATFLKLLVKKPQDTTSSQLKELVSNKMLKAMFPGLSIPVSTASVERSFSQIKLIKTRLRITNSLSDCSLSQLMRIAIESPEVLSDSDLEEVVNVWQRKARRITV